MPHYVYRGKTHNLKTVDGVVEADDERTAILQLTAQGIVPLSVREAVAGQTRRQVSHRRRVPKQTLAYMSRQLADLLGGGLPLFNALTSLQQQTEHRVLRQVLQDVSESVREGRAFSDALAQHPDVFSTLYLSLIRAGETGGGLEGVLGRLADVLESEAELRSRLGAAFVYPSVVLVVGILTVIVLLTYVLPQLTALFAQTGQLLPLPTRLLLAISASMTQGWWAWIGLIGLLAWLPGLVRRSDAGRAAVDRVVLRAPLAGPLVRKIQIARFARNLGMMIGQGVAMLLALEVSSASLGNSVLRQALGRVREAVRDGDSVSHALAASGQFPIFVSNLVAVGEESGTLEAALLKVAGSYERDTDRTLRMLATVLEPALIVGVGLIVGFIVISTLLPVFQLDIVAT